MMLLSNAEIAAKLGQMAALLREEGVNRFKVKAYRTAADSVRSFPQRISELVARGAALPRIPGVGASIGSAIVEIVQSGELESVQRMQQRYHPGTAAIAEAARISLREAQRLAKALHVETPDELRRKLTSGEVAGAVGDRLEFKVRQGLEDVGCLLWTVAHNLARQFQTALENTRGVLRVEIAGSLRRGKDTVGTLQFVVAASKPKSVRAMLRAHGGVDKVLDESEFSIRCKLASGPLLIARVATRANWGTARVEATGSPEHLDEVARVVEVAPRRQFESEEAWYAARGVPWIPPELREGRGEVLAAQKDKLPSLIELTDIRGDLHAHTTASDGANTLEEMVRAARARGYTYLAITDHSKSLKLTNGLDEKRLRAQMQAIDKLNDSLTDFRVLKGSEVDILEDGSLDFGAAILRRLDIVIGSVHSRFGLDKAQQTQRLLRAIENPYITCVGHLTGRKLLKRPGYDLDLERVLRAVKRHGKFLEINASPDRLDIDDTLAQRARQLGIPLLINTDAHSTREFDFMAHGIRQARRGWQSARTVVNTQPLPQLLRSLAATRKRKTA